jgi:LysM repeat protein
MPRKSNFLFLLPLMIITVFISACSRSALGTSYATATSGGVSPFPAATVNSIENVQRFATQTALAGTLLAGGTIQTPLPNITPSSTTGTPFGTAASPTFFVPSITPSSSTGISATVTVTVGRPAQYTIMSGEYLYCLARRFNVDPGELASLNPQVGDLSENNIPSGLVLTIPQTGNPFPGERSLHTHPTTYTVPENMSVYRVACYFGDVDPSLIIQANNLTQPYNVSAGQALTIP